MKKNKTNNGLVHILCLGIFLFPICQAQDVIIKFTVVTPKTTPQEAIVYIAGNHQTMGNWNPGGIALNRINDSTWSKELYFSKGQELEYKITLGSWNSQALYSSTDIPPNSRKVVTMNEEVIIHPTNWSNAIYQKYPGGITGTVRYHTDLKGEGLNYSRNLIVWLPPSYEKLKSKRYPVLYMHDGQNIIDPSTSFIGYDWHVDEVSDSLIRAGIIEEIIIIGIYNSPDRISEYSNTDLGRAYMKFVVTKVKPFIDSVYRTKPDRMNTAVMGSSMGGLISFLFVWWYPEVFFKAGCLSSVFNHYTGSALNLVSSEKRKDHDIKIYFDCGGYGDELNLKSGMDEMIELLRERGYEEGIDFNFYYDKNAEHSERAWSARIWRPLIYMFGN